MSKQVTENQGGLFERLFEPEPDPIWGDRWIRKDRQDVNQKPFGRVEQPIIPAASITFDWQQAKEEMREAIDRADANADPTWKEAFYNALVHVARSAESFTADEVWKRLAELPHARNTADNRAAGGVIMRAKRNGIIALTNITKPSQRKHCHQTLQRVYRSLIYGKQLHEIPAYESG